MRKIVTAKGEDLPEILRCYGRCLDASEGPLPFLPDDLRRYAQEGGFFLLKDGKRVLGAAKVSHDVAKTFFPKSKSESAAGELLAMISYQGEPLAILEAIFLDPQFQGKGLGRELLGFLLSRYKGSSWFASVPFENQRAKKVLLDAGFLFLPGVTERPGEALLAKRYKKDGLCQWNW